MRSTPDIRGVCLLLGLALAASTASFSQERAHPGAFVGPFSDTPIISAPFSADATTIVTQIEQDGTLRKRIATSRYFRDSIGRVRVEYDVPSRDSRATSTERKTLAAVLPDPSNRLVYTVDDATRSIRPHPLAGVLFNAAYAFAIPTGTVRFTVFHTADVHAPGDGVLESLGTTRIEGVDVNGLRITSALPVGQFDERWESPELRVVVYARHHNTGRGIDIDYRLTNIRRGEPASDLFVVPADYTMNHGSHVDPLLSVEAPEAERRREGRK